MLMHLALMLVAQDVGVIRPEPNYGNLTRQYNHQPIEVDFDKLKVMDQSFQFEGRLPEWYDCMGLDDCVDPASLPKPKMDPPWPDWRDPSSYFMPGIKGWIVENKRDQSYQQYIEEKDIVGQWIAKNQDRLTPVLVMEAGSIFLISKDQKSFFNAYRAGCIEAEVNACVHFRPLSESNETTRRSVDLKLDYMVEHGIIGDRSVYDTVLYYNPSPPWDQRAFPKRLARIIDQETTRWAGKARRHSRSAADQVMARTVLNLGKATDEFVERYLLTPYELRFAKLIGPDPEQAEWKPKPPKETPQWVRVVYATKIAGEIVWSSDAWIKAGEREIGRLCGDCSWESWYCGQEADVRLGRRGPVCVGSDGPFVPLRGYLPGDRSLKDIQYTDALRPDFNSEVRIDPYGYDFESKANPIIPVGQGHTLGAVELYYLELRRKLMDDQTANRKADIWLGVENDYPDIDALLKKYGLEDFSILEQHDRILFGQN